MTKRPDLSGIPHINAAFKIDYLTPFQDSDR
jgi:hypothetical protein